MKTYNKIMKCFFNETKFGENSLGEMGELKCGLLWPFFLHLNKSTILDATFFVNEMLCFQQRAYIKCIQHTLRARNVSTVF